MTAADESTWTDEGPFLGSETENEPEAEASSTQTSDGPDSEEVRPGRSTIKFPYADLKEAARVPGTIKNHYGSACDLGQLAGAFQQTPSSGAFRTRIAAAAMFGLVVSRKGRVSLTPLGHEVAGGSRAAIATAFLEVELYKRLYEDYRNKILPADAGLTSEIKELGVLASQADRARQILQRSAEFAGFFHAGRDRLLMPPTGTVGDAGEEQKSAPADPPGQKFNGGGHGMADNPILQGLWGMLPPDGDFPSERRAQWFRALAVNLDLVYGDGHLDVQVTPQGTTHDGLR